MINYLVLLAARCRDLPDGIRLVVINEFPIRTFEGFVSTVASYLDHCASSRRNFPDLIARMEVNPMSISGPTGLAAVVRARGELTHNPRLDCQNIDAPTTIPERVKRYLVAIRRPPRASTRKPVAADRRELDGRSSFVIAH